VKKKRDDDDESGDQTFAGEKVKDLRCG